jgi:protoporphyrinogen oxidase
MSKKIMIIGAGPAGLTAAYQALKEIPDAHVSVFEAENRVGGLSTTIEYHGNYIDIGGHRFFSKNAKINELWKELLPYAGDSLSDSGRDSDKTDAAMLVRNRVSRIFYRGKFFDYPITVKPSTFINMGFVNTLKAGCSYIYSSVKKRGENSLEDFYVNRFGKHLYNLFFEDYTQKVWGVHPSRLSASWGAQRVKELSISTIIKESILKMVNPLYKTSQTSLIDRFYYPKFGPGQLYSVMAEKIRAMGGNIHLDSSVQGICIDRNTVKEIKVLHNGCEKKYTCDYLLSTMPVKDLTACFDAESASCVPPNVRKISSELPYRDFITAGLLLKKLKLKNKTKIKTTGNIIPDNWIYIQEPDVKIGRMQIFNNWSPYMVKDGENTVWIGLEYFCTEGDMLWNMDDQAFIQFAIAELAKIKIIDTSDVLDAVRIKVKKAYPAYFGSYDEFNFVKEYLDTIENLYCLGRNGQHKYNNMDHSSLTAIRAVELIKSGKLDKSGVWDVNTEKAYHETDR